MSFIVICDTAIAVYAGSTHQNFAGVYDAWILVDAILFAVIAWRLWRKSRAWAVVGLAFMVLENVDKLKSAPSTFGVITIILSLAIVNAVSRGLRISQVQR